MKHPMSTTGILIVLFILAQLLGLGLLAGSLTTHVDEDGNIQLEYEETAIGERPETEGITSLLFIVIGVGIGTAIILVLARFNQFLIWKIWYFLAVFFAIWISLGSIIKSWIAGLLALGLTAWKIFRPNTYVHNLTEVLIYSGIAVLLVPLFDVLWASVLLIAIAIYDAIAVWKSKHMISMAKFQTDSKLFAGLMLNYDHKAPVEPTKKKSTKHKETETETQSAILGGGDIAFPLVFTGTILQALILEGYSKLFAYGISLIVVATAAISLLGLFIGAKKNKFYPAMPFLAAGCFIGLLLVSIIT